MAKDNSIKRPSLDKLSAAEQRAFKKSLEEYKSFITKGKTPLTFVQQVIAFAKKSGYKEWNKKVTNKAKGFYITNIDATNVALVKFGKKKFEDGLHIIGAHVDSPCLTAKVHPVREKPEGVAIDCYPYGGIYPHQWFDTDVSVIGHCVKKGKTIPFELNGFVNDATIHLSAEDKVQKTYKEAFVPETLDVFIGFKDKKAFLVHMKKKYNITEEDFARTMITIVPRGDPFHLSDLYLAGFGQDDKVCSYAQLHALEAAKPTKTAVAFFMDREEIGSTGYNGALSRFLEQVIDSIAQSYNTELSDVKMRRIFAKSIMISADVDVAYNSNDEAYSQKESASQFGHGIILDRQNGGRYQYSGNNVPLILVDTFMELFAKAKVELRVSSIPPKVNTGGGGTIAMYFNHRGIPTIDMGIPVMNMHGKYSVMFIPDFYQMLKGFKVFFESEV